MRIYECTEISEKILAALTTLLPQLCPECDLPTRKSLNKVINSESTHLFIAENETIAGTLTLITLTLPTGKKAWIEDVVVDVQFRKKGIGKALLIHAIEFCKTNGIKSIDLTSRPDKISANALYQKLGFGQRKTNVYRYTL